MAKFLNGPKGLGKTKEWNVRQMKWLLYEDLFKYSVSKYTNKLIHSNNNLYLRDQIIHNRRGRHLDNDKLGPLNETHGRHYATQSSYTYYSVGIYNELPNNLTMMDNKLMFKKWAKCYYLDKTTKIPMKKRENDIIQPFTMDNEESCVYKYMK